MSEEKAEEEREKLHDQLLCALASDFKKYYFEIWRKELASQRSTSQVTLLLGRVNELKKENVKLRTELDELKEMVLKQKESLKFVYSQTRMLNENICDLANIVTCEKDVDSENK